MTVLGYADFTESRILGTIPVLDGVPLGHIPFPVEAIPSGGASILEHADDTRTKQIPYRDSTAPEKLRAYEFRFELLASEEAVWWHIDALDKGDEDFYFVPWRQETEVFRAGVSLTAFVLPRTTAVSQLPDHEDIGEYVTRAWLDDAAQTVVASGTPGTGEVKVVGRDVTTPTLTAGQVLKIRYAPAYYVTIAGIGPERWNEFNVLTRQIVLTELRVPA